MRSREIEPRGALRARCGQRSRRVAATIAALKLTGDENAVQLLGARESAIFRLLLTGRPAAEIAKLLRLSSKTVARYHTLIEHKLGTPGDVELVLLA
jgi:DNA-binding CsgD family transcriptional regulator